MVRKWDWGWFGGFIEPQHPLICVRIGSMVGKLSQAVGSSTNRLT